MLKFPLWWIFGLFHLLLEHHLINLLNLRPHSHTMRAESMDKFSVFTPIPGHYFRDAPEDTKVLSLYLLIVVFILVFHRLDVFSLVQSLLNAWYFLLNKILSILRFDCIHFALVMLPDDIILPPFKWSLLLDELKLWKLWLVLKLSGKDVELKMSHGAKFNCIVWGSISLLYSFVFLNEILRDLMGILRKVSFLLETSVILLSQSHTEINWLILVQTCFDKGT